MSNEIEQAIATLTDGIGGVTVIEERTAEEVFGEQINKIAQAQTAADVFETQALTASDMLGTPHTLDEVIPANSAYAEGVGVFVIIKGRTITDDPGMSEPIVYTCGATVFVAQALKLAAIWKLGQAEQTPDAERGVVVISKQTGAGNTIYKLAPASR